jgi:3-dehydroquinate dehydratase-2
MKIFVINGPNLNFLGKREPEIYGSLTLKEIENDILNLANELKVEVLFGQSNHEGQIIDWLQECHNNNFDGIILNAGAYTHTSVAIHDAIKSIKVPVIEVHMSNVHAREEFRHHSFIAPVSKGQIVGFGKDSYLLALRALIK